jgi:hypothetical protein
MPKNVFPDTTSQLASLRKQLAPGIHDAFTKFGDLRLR